MKIILPSPIAAYFAADANDSAEAVSRCFTDDATVKDEGHTHIGRLAIVEWKADATSKYSYTSEPLSIGAEDDRIVVSCRLKGDFLGSPLDLRFIFRLQGEKIAELEIIP
jgi:hypothetical protein